MMHAKSVQICKLTHRRRSRSDWSGFGRTTFRQLMKFIIGASVSEPHTSEFNGGISLIYIAILGGLWGEPERVAGCISVS